MTQSNQKRNNVKVKGQGKKPLIFAPGFGFDQSIWANVSRAFEQNYQIILFDYVGFGGSDVNAYSQEKYSDLSGYVEDLLELCSELRLNQAVLVGHSVGSMIGMLASIKQPDLFSKLVLIGPSPCFLNFPPDYYGGFEQEQLQALIQMMEKNYLNFANSIPATILNDTNQSEAEIDIAKQFKSNDPIIVSQFANVIFFSDYREHIKKVPVPSYILQCSNDIFVPDSVAEYVNKELPYSQITYAEAVGHCPHLSHPDETIQIIQKFIHDVPSNIPANFERFN